MSHIIGKVYDLTQENFNKLRDELEWQAAVTKALLEAQEAWVKERVALKDRIEKLEAVATAVLNYKNSLDARRTPHDWASVCKALAALDDVEAGR